MCNTVRRERDCCPGYEIATFYCPTCKYMDYTRLVKRKSCSSVISRENTSRVARKRDLNASRSSRELIIILIPKMLRNRFTDRRDDRVSIDLVLRSRIFVEAIFAAIRVACFGARSFAISHLMESNFVNPKRGLVAICQNQRHGRLNVFGSSRAATQISSFACCAATRRAAPRRSNEN